MTTKGATPESLLARLLLRQADSPKSLTDIEARMEFGADVDSLMDVNRISDDLLAMDRTTEFSCLKCGKDLPIPYKAKNVYCANCGEMWGEGRYPKYEISLNRKSAVEEIRRRLEEQLTRVCTNVRQTSGMPCLQGRYEDIDIGASVLAHRATLADYYSLRGSLQSPESSLSILAAPCFDGPLTHYTRGSPETILVNAEELLTTNTNLSPLIREMHNRITSASRLAKSLGGVSFDEIRISEDISKRMTEMTKSLVPLSLQMGEGSSSAIGNRFQRNVCTILSVFTPIPVRLIGGKNQDDAIIRLFYHGKNKPRYYPVGIKTYEGDLRDKRFYPISEATLQIKKYARSYLQDDILRLAEIPAYVLIAHDFDTSDQTVQDEIRAFQSDIGIPLKLLPVNVILDLANEFTAHPVDEIRNESVEEFLSSPSPYLGRKEAKHLMDSLRDYDYRERKSDIITKVRRRVSLKHS